MSVIVVFVCLQCYLTYGVVLVGLGKQEQGINTCLQVEKTSKRGGKIINQEKGEWHNFQYCLLNMQANTHILKK